MSPSTNRRLPAWLIAASLVLALCLPALAGAHGKSQRGPAPKVHKAHGHKSHGHGHWPSGHVTATATRATAIQAMATPAITAAASRST